MKRYRFTGSRSSVTVAVGGMDEVMKQGSMPARGDAWSGCKLPTKALQENPITP